MTEDATSFELWDTTHYKLDDGNILIPKEKFDILLKDISTIIGKECNLLEPVVVKDAIDLTNTNVIIQAPAVRKVITKAHINPKITVVFGDPVCGFCLKQLPGCCGILLSYGTYVEENYQGRGIAHRLLKFKEEVARYNRFSILMATTNTLNGAENHLLTKFGWFTKESFINSKTGHTVYVWTKKLY